MEQRRALEAIIVVCCTLTATSTNQHTHSTCSLAIDGRYILESISFRPYPFITLSILNFIPPFTRRHIIKILVLIIILAIRFLSGRSADSSKGDSEMHGKNNNTGSGLSTSHWTGRLSAPKISGGGLV